LQGRLYDAKAQLRGAQAVVAQSMDDDTVDIEAIVRCAADDIEAIANEMGNLSDARLAKEAPADD
jgi:hypothetical protein